LPLLLLDDVMSELDPERRRRLVGLLDEGGQALITATESAHVPDGEQHRRIKMESGDAASASGRGGIGGASAQE
jgi:recombinational DNA repair ATPase RecF